MTRLAFTQPKTLLSLVAILAALLLFFGRDVGPVQAAGYGLDVGLSQCAIPFNPVTGEFGSFNEGTDCEYTTGSTFTFTNKYRILEPDPNFSSTITFFPTAYDLKPGTDVDVGAVVGRLQAKSTLGTFDNPCNPLAPVDTSFSFLNGSLDYSAGNQISARAPGESNRLIPMRQDANYSGTTDGAGDINTIVDSTATFPTPNGLVDFLLSVDIGGTTQSRKVVSNTATTVDVSPDFGTTPGSGRDYVIGDGLPDGVDKVPDFIVAFSDPDFISAGIDGLLGTADDIDGPLTPIIPWSRLAGTTDVANVAVVLQFVMFEPGALTAFEAWKPYAESLSITGALTGATVDSPTAGITTLQDTTAGKFDGEPLVNRTITMTSGGANTESQVILTQDASAQEITVANFTGTPAATDTYTIGGIPTKEHPFSQFDSSYGWASVTFLATSNPFELKASPSNITDFCSPLDVGITILGESYDNGCTPVTNVGTGDCPLKAACDGQPLYQGICPEIPALPAELGGGGVSAHPAPDEGGVLRQVSPQPNTGILGTNTHLYVGYAVGQRDADGDGIENALDPCDLIADSWDPRITTAQPEDPDGDGIPNLVFPGPTASCDTNPGGAANDDDDDGFTNHQDNCPVDPNGSMGGAPQDYNADQELLLGYPDDGGPRGDQIGDVCDPDDLTSDGSYKVALDLTAVCLDDGTGDPGGAGDSTAATDPPPSLTGDSRSTWCTDTLTALGASSPPEHMAVHYGMPLHEGTGLAETPYTQPCNDEVDTDGDGQADGSELDSGDAGSEPDCDGTGDWDGDGFSDGVELLIGTDPRYRCSQPGHTYGDANLAGLQDAWPADTYPNSIRLVDGQDLVAFLPSLFKGPGQAGYSVRFDIYQPSAVVDGQDLVAMLPHLFQGCTPYAGP